MPQSLTPEEIITDLLCQGHADEIFPGAAAAVAYGLGNQRRCHLAFCGKRTLLPQPVALTHETIFDLASLTKPLATVLSIISLIEAGNLCLETRIAEFFGHIIPDDKKNITLFHLLTHSSGLPAHRPYFELLRTLPAAERRATLHTLILNEPLVFVPGQLSLYSDLGFLLLGSVVEQISGLPLNCYVEERLYPLLGMKQNLFFRSGTATPPTDTEKFAATELCPWRGRLLCGEVHDDNAWVLDGVAGHAGLFGTVAAVLELCSRLLDIWKGIETSPAFSQPLLAEFFTRQTRIPDSTWALGFDTPSAINSSAGTLFSPFSVGHLGFTGTSIWIDPEKNVIAVLLSNRVHPTRDNIKIRKFRPIFHDVAVRACLMPMKD